MIPRLVVDVEDSPIHVAASQGNVEEISRLLRARDAEVGELARYPPLGMKVAPLHVAADAKTVRFLLAVGAPLDEGVQGWTPLHHAAHEGRLDVARALLDARANLLSVYTVTGEQPLHRAALLGHADLVRLLLARGAPLEATAKGGTRPLHYAATTEVLDVLLEAGADPTARDDIGATALDLLLRRGDELSMKRLAAAGGTHGDTPCLSMPARAQRGLLTLAPMGCQGVLPAIVIGYDFSGWRSGPEAPRRTPRALPGWFPFASWLTNMLRQSGAHGFAEAPSERRAVQDIQDIQQGLAGWLPHASWLMNLEQQAGGYSMCYPEVLGLMLRLEANGDRARTNPSRLLRGFLAMAEDPEYPLLEREYPRLRPCTGTEGDPYPPESLVLLHEEVSRVFAVPGFDEGYEAFVRFEECDLLQVFGGWRMLGLRTPPDASPFANGYSSFSSMEDELVRDEDVRLTPETLRALQRYCEQFAGARLPPPRAWLLWNNSD